MGEIKKEGKRNGYIVIDRMQNPELLIEESV